jgi:hypothetical protein
VIFLKSDFFLICDFKQNKIECFDEKISIFQFKKYHFEEIYGIGEKTVQIKYISRLKHGVIAENSHFADHT